MKKKNSNQLSIFDIMIDHQEGTSIAISPIQETKSIIIENVSDKVLCPFPIPTVNEIIKKIKSAAYRIGTSQFISDVFECGAISISNTVDYIHRNEREKKYLEIINKYEPQEQKFLAEIFGMIYALLTSVVYDNGTFSDYLGELFMLCNQGNKHAGQFFTPYHISHFMAKAVLQDELVEKARNNEILTICDPCCGGGGMMIAALDVLKNDYNINYAHNCFIECSDIDIRCVYMCYLQLSLAGVPAIIKHQDSITRQAWSVWKTPAFLMQYPRFYKYENNN